MWMYYGFVALLWSCDLEGFDVLSPFDRSTLGIWVYEINIDQSMWDQISNKKYYTAVNEVIGFKIKRSGVQISG